MLGRLPKRFDHLSQPRVINYEISGWQDSSGQDAMDARSSTPLPTHTFGSSLMSPSSTISMVTRIDRERRA